MAPTRAGQRQWSRARGANETVAQRFVNPLSTRAETAIAFSLPRAGKQGDRVGAALDLRKEIQPRAVRPCVARNPVDAAKADLMRKRRARVFEYLVERPAHRQDRGPDVDHRSPDLDLPHLAAGPLGGFERRDRKTARRERRRRGQAAHSGADDQDMSFEAQERLPILPLIGGRLCVSNIGHSM